MPLEAVDGWMWHRMRMSVTFWVFTLQPLPVTVTRRNVSVARTHLHTLDFLLRTTSGNLTPFIHQSVSKWHQLFAVTLQ